MIIIQTDAATKGKCSSMYALKKKQYITCYYNMVNIEVIHNRFYQVTFRPLEICNQHPAAQYLRLGVFSGGMISSR